ncbi:YciI family protein [Actinomadura roseirufa]|uniref:YciI family protein n=1 Tax=Actinomadura roseirufa TaxID=2094049 RepID=UPI001F5F07B1|nr:YciI family protein [Actinomadura roseirufa]
MLIMHSDPAVWDALTEEKRNEVMSGHGAFMETIKESGEMLGTVALADRSESVVVSVREGVAAVTDGPYLKTEEFLGGYYLVDCKDKDRAVELAALIPDAGVEGLGIEVRRVLFQG